MASKYFCSLNEEKSFENTKNALKYFCSLNELNIWHLTFDFWHFDIWHLKFWHLTFDIWYLKFDIWHLTFWHLTFDIWHLTLNNVWKRQKRPQNIFAVWMKKNRLKTPKMALKYFCSLNEVNIVWKRQKCPQILLQFEWRNIVWKRHKRPQNIIAVWMK